MSSRIGGSRRLERVREVRPRAQLSGAAGQQWGVVGLVVAVVVVSALLAQGRQVHPTPKSESGTAVTLSRTLACIRDSSQTSVGIGSVPASSTGFTTTSGARSSSTRVEFTPSAAASGYASQWVRGHGWFAARACPTPEDDWWFVGVGAGVAHRSVLTLDNTRANDANVTITVYGPQGRVEAPGLSGLSVPAGESTSISLPTVAPSVGDLTVHVSAVRGLVAASVWETWAETPTSAVVAAWVPPASAPTGQVGLLGVPGKIDHSTLLVTNPGATSTVVGLKAVSSSATFVPAKHPSVTVPPYSTVAVELDDLIKLGIAGMQLTSSKPITAGLRSARDGVEAYAAPMFRLGTQSTVGLPAGVSTQVVLTAPTSSKVTVTAIDAQGGTVLTTSLALGPSAKALALPKNAVAVKISADASSTASAAILTDGPGIAVIGMVPTGNAATVPAVVARPY